MVLCHMCPYVSALKECSTPNFVATSIATKLVYNDWFEEWYPEVFTCVLLNNNN